MTKILIVEDDPDGQIVLKRLLAMEGISADIVSTGEAALKALSELSYAGVIIDLGLPGIDGMSLVKQIRVNYSKDKLPCVAITAYHNSSVRQEAQQMGFNAYYPKPIDLTQFAGEIRVLLSNLDS
ncbi:MAG: response regulator [Phototrophicales bacterium]|nr:MAG: response regulator [Chloroflexota bacterium]